MPGLEEMWGGGAPQPTPTTPERPASGARMSPQKQPQGGIPPQGSPSHCDGPRPESTATQEEQAEFVALLNSMSLDSFYRTLAEQALDSLPLLIAASREGVLHKKLTHACVPDRVRTALYGVVQTHSVRQWDARHQPGARRPRRPKPETTLVFENGKLTEKSSGPVVRQTRASRCGAVWVNRRCEHLGDKDPGYSTPAVLDKRVTQRNARKAWKVAGTAARWQGKFGALKVKKESEEQTEAPFEFDDCTLHVRSIEREFENTDAVLEIFSAHGEVLYVALREKHGIEEANNVGARKSWALVTMRGIRARDAVLDARPIMAGNELGVGKMKVPANIKDQDGNEEKPSG